MRLLHDFKLLFLFLALLLSIAFQATQVCVADDDAEYPEFPTYRQELKIRFADEASALRAKFAIEPLYDGHYRAVSCRWDDNWTSDNEKTREVMEECGIKGTWYLNGPTFSPEGKPADYSAVAKKLLEGGNSVGGHSMTHPYVTYFHSNRMFAEMAGVRIAWEAALDTPVTSYAYSFVDVRPRPEARAVMLRTLETLERAGFYHTATFNFFDDVKLRLEYSPIMPPENSPFEVFRNSVDWAYNDPGLSDRYPMISNSMHAWYDTARLNYGYEELRKRFDLLNSLEDIWHCNQNEYAAYRRQVRLSNAQVVNREGKVITLSLERPELVALNDPTPLTLSISGVEPDEVESLECASAEIQRSERSVQKGLLLHVSHDKNRRLPTKIGHLANDDNSSELGSIPPDADFPAVVGILSQESGELRIRLQNNSQNDLQNLRIRWRVPLGWKVEQPLQLSESCQPGETLEFSQPLIAAGDPLQRFGEAHFAAQVDFLGASEPGRIYLTCKCPGPGPDDSFPLDHFALLGPIPNEQFSAESFADCVQRDDCPEEFLLQDGSKITWRPAARDGYVTHEWMNPEYVRTMGTWDHISPTFVLRAKVFSDVDQVADLVLSHDQLSRAMLNGTQAASPRITLREGENELIIIYPGAQMSQETQRLSACFVRLADPESGIRLKNIRYRPY